ncbi:MAG: hypothetical protein DYG89_51505 [Caldilinea sp. CFX5]|nr:hypothetical protein [Caldilinea sp. CFX5]
MTFRHRNYPEVLDSLLTGITKGVAAEEHAFPPATGGPPFQNVLEQAPVGDIISVYGSRDGATVLFRKGADYKLLPDGKTLAWQKGAQLPDAGTLIQVNYYPKAAQPVLTDIQTGSVVRTLAESVGLEIARLYAQLEAVYNAGFVDTATDGSLDKVVALLGIERVAGGHAAGEVEFTRAPNTLGAIAIPAGTRVITADGNIEYETTEAIELSPGQNTARVVARDLEINDPLPAGALTVLPIPIAGILTVTNPAPTAIATQDESDSELRTRAKNFLHGSERGTLGAIKAAIARQRITADVEEPAATPGVVEITPHAESLPPELYQRLLTAVEDARPAGVRIVWKGVQPPAKVNLTLRLTTTTSLLEQDLRAAQRSVREKIADYFARLPAREPGSINRLVGLVLSVPGVEDVRLLAATWNNPPQDVLDLTNGLLHIEGAPTQLGELTIADPNLPTRLDTVVTYPASATPPDLPKIKGELTNTLGYLNDANASDTTPATTRTLSFGKLLFAIPLPNKPAASLPAYDQAVNTGGVVPTLPDGTTVQPYQVQFIFTAQSGLSRIVTQASDAYTLTAFERLTLADVTIEQEATNG